MNVEMAYLLGMITGNGCIQRDNNYTTIRIDIPHKKLLTENEQDVRVYVSASINNIRSIIQPLVGTDLVFTQNDNNSILSFTKSNEDYLIREIHRYVRNATTHESMRISSEVFKFTFDERKAFVKGFGDVTGYIRRSNRYMRPFEHRVYIEIPRNWYLVADFCNLLTSIDIPVQTIDWGHPNFRDSNLEKYNHGNRDFWKKEHQIKIWAVEYEKVGFAVIHKSEALSELANEHRRAIKMQGRNIDDVTHKYYWESNRRRNARPHHPGENDEFIPEEIRGKHYESWKDLAEDIGYKEV